MDEQPADLARRCAVLEARLRRLEDKDEIAQLIASYGPLADSGDAEAVADRWEPDGVYEVDEWSMNGRDAIMAMITGAKHQSWIKRGCAHFLGPAHITIQDDKAVAVGHSLMVVHNEGEFVVRRATANRWQLRRCPQGWRVTLRTSRVLNGSAESPRLLDAIGLGFRWG